MATFRQDTMKTHKRGLEKLIIAPILMASVTTKMMESFLTLQLLTCPKIEWIQTQKAPKLIQIQNQPILPILVLFLITTLCQRSILGFCYTTGLLIISRAINRPSTYHMMKYNKLYLHMFPHQNLLMWTGKLHTPINFSYKKFHIKDNKFCENLVKRHHG